MKINCIISCCTYDQSCSIPNFFTKWDEFFPSVDKKIILISDVIPPNIAEYTDNIILFNIPKIRCDFIKTCVHVVCPSLLSYDNGILVVDFLISPVTESYYILPLKYLDDNMLVCYNDSVHADYITSSTTCKKLFNISSHNDLTSYIVNLNIKYQKITQHFMDHFQNIIEQYAHSVFNVARKIVFSYSIYKNTISQCLGMLENIELINKHNPIYEIRIYCAKNIDKYYIDKFSEQHNVTIFKINETGPILKCYKYLAIDDDNVNVCIIREPEMRVTTRDMWCITEFANSEYNYHTIRDHCSLKKKIIDGIFGIKKMNDISINGMFINWKINNSDHFSDDDVDLLFLNATLYYNITDNLLVHTDIVAFKDEKYENILIPRIDEYDFVGNYYDLHDEQLIPTCMFNNINVIDHIIWLQQEERHEILMHLFDYLLLMKVQYKERNTILNLLFSIQIEKMLINFTSCDINICINLLNMFSTTFVDRQTIINSNRLFDFIDDQVIGTTFMRRQPNDNEILIYYGNYCDDINSLPISNTIYRNIMYYTDTKHANIEYDDCWNDVNQIYILNISGKSDKYANSLSEFGKINAPISRIKCINKQSIYSATTNEDLHYHLNIIYAHLVAYNDMKVNNYKYCLVVTDDFIFNFNYNTHKQNIKLFFENNYDFNICCLGGFNYNIIANYDDLLMVSHNCNITTTAYILSLKSLDIIINCIESHFKYLTYTHDYTKYAHTKMWNKLPCNNNLFVFKQKVGYSNISCDLII